MFRKWSLKKQFATVFLVLITLPTILFGILIYYQATDAFKEQAEKNTVARLLKNDENLTSVIRNIETMSAYMIFEDGFQTFLTEPEDNLQQIRQAEESIKGYFTFQLMSHDYIDSVYLIGNTGNSLDFGTPLKVEESQLAIEAKEMRGGPYWSDSYQAISEWGGTKKVISLSRMINELDEITKSIGMVRVRLDTAKLYQTIETDLSRQGSYFVLTEKGHVVLHENQDLVGKPFPDQRVIDLVVNNEETMMSYQTDDDTYLLVKKPVAGTNWFSVVSINQGEVVQELYQVRSLIINMILLLFLLGIIAFIGFYFSNIKRITELAEQTKQVESGNFSAKVKVNSQDEIGELGTQFNNMVETIQQFIDREYKLKIKQKESELKVLQNQIDPHFLYNTLDMIRWTARIENAMETGQLIERLSKIFRMNLNQGKMWVSVEEELTYIQNYLELQKSRMGERLQFSIFYEDQIKHLFIMKQIIQPVVENSIVHGFKNLPRQGYIKIRGYRNGDSLYVDIIDNGWGFPEKENVLKSEKDSSYALKNIQERLEIAFGEKFSLERLSQEEGAWIQLKIPVLVIKDVKAITKESGDQDGFQNADSG